MELAPHTGHVSNFFGPTPTIVHDGAPAWTLLELAVMRPTRGCLDPLDRLSRPDVCDSPAMRGTDLTDCDANERHHSGQGDLRPTSNVSDRGPRLDQLETLRMVAVSGSRREESRGWVPSDLSASSFLRLQRPTLEIPSLPSTAQTARRPEGVRPEGVREPRLDRLW